jgi:transcriptional regulator with XRE-family HTH domain
MDLKDYRRQLMQDPKVAAARRQLQPKLDLGRQVLHLRLEHGWTQKELAEKAGTKQANISRLENGLLNPSVDMLQRVASALGAELTVILEPTGQPRPAPSPS